MFVFVIVDLIIRSTLYLIKYSMPFTNQDKMTLFRFCMGVMSFENLLDHPLKGLERNCILIET